MPEEDIKRGAAPDAGPVIEPATEQAIKPGSRVRLHYALRLSGGEQIDGCPPQSPLEFSIGDGTLLPALEHFLYGMRSGEQALYKVHPDEGFGLPDPQAVQWMARSAFPEALAPEVGQVIAFDLPTGEQVPGSVLAVEDERVQVDFNHPLAGQTFFFQVGILAVDE